MLEEYKSMISKYYENIQYIKDMTYKLLEETPLVHKYISMLRVNYEDVDRIDKQKLKKL